MRARRVDDYLQNFETYSVRYLDRLMQTSTTISGETSDGFFSNIWIPTRKYNSQTGKLDENYTYYNCGLSSTELADLYWTQYSGNYLIGRRESIEIDYAYLETRCSAIFKKNLGKYRRLLELEGLIWNPLWNVDGVEIHQLLEKHGAESYLESGSGSSATGRNLKDSRSVTAYDSNTLKPEYEETYVGQDTSTPSASATYGSDTISSSGGKVSHADTISSEAKASKSVRSHDAFTYAVKVEDTAFGTAISDADVLHTEKTVRQGNIGVTKTTELISDARRVVAYSIIQEFFNDINAVILVGVWDIPDDIPWWCDGQSSGGQTTPEHPDTGRISSVYNSGYNSIQSVELDEYGHVIGLTTCDGVTKVFTPMTQEQYENTDPKDQALYMIYE